jgi:Carboxypeptidase regulatory-like domain
MTRTQGLARTLKSFAMCWFALALVASAPNSHAKTKDTTPGRLLTGKVLDKQDNPIPDAVVYVTDTRTRAVKTYIVGPDGTYRFPALATNVDYEIYAQANGKASDTKRMSQFDDRKVVDIVLRIDIR